MYLWVLVTGLVVYGSDFNSITGWLYVTPLIVLAVFHKWVWSRRFSLCSPNTVRIISVIAVLVALLVYTPLHMDYWDEHSVTQALWMALLGVCSYLISVIAATEISSQNSPCRRCASGALALIGVFWLFALYYPMIVLFFLGLLFVVSMVWFNPQQSEQKVTTMDNLQSDIIAKYTLFVLAIDIGCVIWDHQVNTTWAYFIGGVFIAAALGFYIKLADHSERLEQPVYIVAIINFTLAIIWPVYTLWSLHAIVVGLCMGYLLPQAISQSGYNQPSYNQPEFKENPRLSMGWMVWIFLGLVLSNAWYANLQWAFTRLIVILPFVILGILYVRYRFAALKHQT